jgi:vacuolar iron transporter family protein
MAKSKETRRWMANLIAEREAANLYQRLAGAETDPERASILRELAQAELRHANRWEGKLHDVGVSTAHGKPSLRVRVLGLLARRIGASSLLPLLEADELSGVGMYDAQPDAGGLPAEERSHARVFRALARRGVPTDVASLEGWHRRDASGSLRASVFGINDGLVSNLSLVLGVAGAAANPRFILVAGIAGLLAGSFSMGAGEYISISSQRELFERQLELEEEELSATPEEEEAELALIYRAKGIPQEQAESLAKRIISDPSAALDTLSREELGLDRGALGSPWRVSISSFTAFAVGAFIPILPYLLGAHGGAGIALAALLAALALLTTGLLLSFLTGRNPLLTAGRMILVGALASGVTFLVGHVLGVAAGG